MTSSQVIHIYTSPTNKTTNTNNNNTNKNKTPDNKTNQTQAAEAAKAAKAATKAAKAANSAAAATIATKTIKTAEPIIINPTLIALEAAEEFITKMDSAFAEFESLHPQPSSSSLSHCSSHSNGNSHGNSNGNSNDNSNVNTSNVTLDSNDFDFENESQNGIDNINNVNDNVNEGHSEEDIRFDGDDFFREDDDDANVNFDANTNGFHNSESNAPIGNNACFEKSEIVQEHNADLNTYVNTNCSPINSSSNGNNDDSDISDNMMNSITQGIQNMNHNDDTQEQEQENSIDISQEDYDCQYDCNGVDDDYNNDDDDDNDGWQDDSASSFTSEDFGSQHFTQTGRGGLDVVQEEDEYDEEDEDDEQFEEEEEYEEEEEELGENSVEEVEDYQQQQDQLPEQQQQKEEVDTAWQDDNDFFTFTDEEEEEEDESLLVTPQAQQLQNSRTKLKSKSKQLTQTQEKQFTIDNESSSCLNDKEKIDTIPKTQIQPQPQPQDPPIQPQDPPENGFSSNGHNGKYHNHYNSKNTNNSMSSNSNHNNIIHNNMNDQGDNNTLKDKEQKQESSSSLSSSITVSISSSLETNETAITPSSNITASTPSSSQQQLQPLSSQQSSQLPPSCAKTLTYMYIDQSNTDKLAQSHAEDVLSLTLEIQNLREQLAKEQEQNGKAKIYLEQEEEKSVSLEMKMVQCKAETDMMKDEYEKEILCIREECELYKSKLSEAEQDATQALGIAKDSDEKMAQMEELLKKTLDEVEQLRAQQQQQANQLPMISEQYMEGSFDNGSYGTPGRMSNRLSTSVSSLSPYRRDKAVVTIGRNLLRQVAESDDNMSDASESTYGDGSTTSNSSYLVTLTRRSQEKRQRLRDSMNRNNEGGPTGREVVCFSSPSSQNGGLDLGYGSAFIATVKTVSKIMKHSGKKLNLGGRWFNGGKASAMKLKRKGLRSDSDDLDLESMTRNYCRSVEALVSKQRDEVKELQQFCGFLEQKLG